MKFYSEKLNKLFNTEEELINEEKVLEEKEAAKNALKEKRAERAKEVEEAYKVAREAKEKADKILQEFLKDYGNYHYTIASGHPFAGWLGDFFKL